MNTVDMIKVVECISSLDVPIIFKGSIVLKTALCNINLDTGRQIRDIDGDWVGEPPSMSSLKNIFNQAIVKAGLHMRATTKKDYIAGVQAAKFNVVSLDTNRKEFSINLSVKQNPYFKEYISTVNHTRFYGATCEKMVVDKLRGISDQSILGRAKDLYDLHLLSSFSGYNTREILDMPIRLERQLGPFHKFMHNKDDVEEAYNKLDGITSKPNFEVLYDGVTHFIWPFIQEKQEKQEEDYTWDTKNWISNQDKGLIAPRFSPATGEPDNLPQRPGPSAKDPLPFLGSR